MEELTTALKGPARVSSHIANTSAQAPLELWNNS